MKILNAINDGLRGSFSFSGRAGRTQYWFFLGFFLLVLYLASLLDSLVIADYLGFLPGEQGAPKHASTIVCVLFLAPIVSATVRRIHDLGWSGFWAILLVPLVAVLTLVSFPELGYQEALQPILIPLYSLWLSWWWPVLAVPFIPLALRGQRGANKYGPA